MCLKNDKVLLNFYFLKCFEHHNSFFYAGGGIVIIAIFLCFVIMQKKQDFKSQFGAILDFFVTPLCFHECLFVW